MSAASLVGRISVVYVLSDVPVFANHRANAGRQLGIGRGSASNDVHQSGENRRDL